MKEHLIFIKTLGLKHQYFKCAESQPHWLVTGRNQLKFKCSKKGIKSSVLRLPTYKAYESGKWHLALREPTSKYFQTTHPKIVIYA